MNDINNKFRGISSFACLCCMPRKKVWSFEVRYYNYIYSLQCFFYNIEIYKTFRSVRSL